MPTYDYQCRACGTVTELIHSMLEDGPSVCDLCGGELRRVIYPSGIIFKGSGFYRNDSRASSNTGGGTDKDGGSEKAVSSGKDGQPEKAPSAGSEATGSTTAGNGSASPKPTSTESEG